MGGTFFNIMGGAYNRQNTVSAVFCQKCHNKVSSRLLFIDSSMKFGKEVPDEEPQLKLKAIDIPRKTFQDDLE